MHELSCKHAARQQKSHFHTFINTLRWCLKRCPCDAQFKLTKPHSWNYKDSFKTSSTSHKSMFNPDKVSVVAVCGIHERGCFVHEWPLHTQSGTHRPHDHEPSVTESVRLSKCVCGMLYPLLQVFSCWCLWTLHKAQIRDGCH